MTLRQQPRQLGVLGDVALAEEDAALGIEARGEQDRGRVVQALAQLGGVVGDRGRVQVDDAEDALAALLARDVLGDRADVVAEVLAPGRLDAGEDAHRPQPSAQRRRSELSVSHGGSQPRVVLVDVRPGRDDLVDAVEHAPRSASRSSAGSWLSSCSIVRGPMIAAVTAGWSVTNASAISISEMPASSASSPSACAASSFAWLPGIDMS